MAKIRDRETKDVSGAYKLVFGNAELGVLTSKVHGTTISNGIELEKIIKSMVQNVPDLDEFLRLDIMPDGVFLATKKQIKKCQTLDSNNQEPDFLIFKRRDDEQRCHVIELKAGHAFDTKRLAPNAGRCMSLLKRTDETYRLLSQLIFVPSIKMTGR